MANTSRIALLILGMHRSGTSAFTRMCNLLGAEVSENLLPPENDNEEGFWEHADIVAIQDRLLAGLSRRWDDTRNLPENWIAKSKEFTDEIAYVLKRDFAESTLYVVKDPRISILLPAWKNIVKAQDTRLVTALMFRDPYAVAASLKKRNDFAYDKSLLLWCMHNVEAEHASRDIPRTFVSFDSFTANPKQTADKLAKDLEISWPQKDASLSELIKPALVHHKGKSVEGDIHPDIRKYTDELYTLLQAAENGNVDTKAFDRIRTALKDIARKVEEFAHFWVTDAILIRDLAIELERHNTIFNQEKQSLREYTSEQQKAIDTLNIQFNQLEHRIMEAEQVVKFMKESTSWKITAPLRAAVLVARAGLDPANWQRLRSLGFKDIVKHGLLYLKNNMSPNNEGVYRTNPNEYQCWIQSFDTLTEKDRAAIKEHIDTFEYQPLISVVMPVYNVDEKWLRLAIESVQNQLYTNWEFCIADDASPKPHIKQVLQEYAAKDKRIKVVFRETNGHISESSNSALALATGEFVALLDHDDVLPEYALYYVVNEINEHPDVDLIYSDEDKIDEAGTRFDPYFKTEWNPDLFFGQNMFSHLGVFRRSILTKINGFRKGREGSQDYDLTLRSLPHTTPDRIRHIPKILYHWRAIEGSTARGIDAKMYAFEAARKVIGEYVQSQCPGARMQNSTISVHHRVVWPVPDPAPLVSIIIPTKNGMEILKRAVDSIVEKTQYPNYEILIVNNQSDDPATLAYFKDVVNNPKIRVMDYNKPFNYAAINNEAVKAVKGEVICLLNNDTEVINAEWLTEMVGQALRKDVGAVGAKLYFPDNTIQHGGVILGGGYFKGTVARHFLIRMPRSTQGYFGRAQLVHDVSAVTAACLVVRRELYQKVGGMDEKELQVAYNDIDFCLKLRAKGLLNVWTPYAELYHHESATRGKDDTAERMERLNREAAVIRMRWKDQLAEDRYYSPNLDMIRANFELAFPPRVTKPWLKKEEEKQKAAYAA